MTNTSTADTMNLRELNPEELNSVSGGLSWDDFWEGVKEFFAPPKHAELVMWP